MSKTQTFSPDTGVLGEVLSSGHFNIYLGIVTFGLVLKLIVSARELISPSRQNRHLRPELLLFIVCFLLYSISQIFVFAPIVLTERLGLSRALIVKTFYMFDGVCLLVSIYLMLSMLGYERHKNGWVLGVAFAYVFVGSYFLYGTDAFLSPALPSEYSGVSGLGGGYGGPLVLLARSIVLASLVFVCYGIYRCYQDSQANQLQIKSLYSLLACFFYTANCLVGLFKVFPTNISIRGIVFFVVVMVLVRKNKFFDIRLSTPRTLENRLVGRYRRIFLDYSNENVDHKTTLLAIEKLAVEYKLDKAKGFSPNLKTALPKAASSMGVNQSSIYNLVRKHGLDLPTKRGGTQ